MELAKASVNKYHNQILNQTATAFKTARNAPIITHHYPYINKMTQVVDNQFKMDLIMNMKQTQLKSVTHVLMDTQKLVNQELLV